MIRPSMSVSIPLSLALSLACTVAAHAQDAPSRFHTAANVALGWNDNIGLTADERDKIDVVTTELSVDLNYNVIESADVELTTSVTPFYQWVSDVDDLSNYGAVFGVDLRGAFGQAFTDPWYQASIDYTVATFRDSDPRDGSWLELQLTLGKRFTPLFGISGGYRYEQRWQRDDDPECVTGGCAPQFNWAIDEVFDLQRNGVFAHVDLQPAESTGLFLEYSYWTGDVAVTGRGARPNEPVVDDLALGGFDTAGIYRVWRSEADQHVVEVGAERSFGNRWSALLSAYYLWTTDVDSGISEDDYENTVVTLSLVFDF